MFVKSIGGNQSNRKWCITGVLVPPEFRLGSTVSVSLTLLAQADFSMNYQKRKRKKKLKKKKKRKIEKNLKFKTESRNITETSTKQRGHYRKTTGEFQDLFFIFCR